LEPHMFLPSLKLVAPTLWFLSSFGLAQFNPTPATPSKPVVDGKTSTQPAVKIKRKTKVAKKQKTRTKTDTPVIRIAQLKPKKVKAPVTTKAPVVCNTVAEMKSNVSCVVEKIQATYRSMKSITADFTQTYTYAVYQRTQTSQGKVFLKSPGRMRWDYKSPTPKVFVADGTTLWVYEPTKNQAYKRPLTDSQLPVAIRFLMGEGNLLKEFVPAFESADDAHITVRLTPRNATNKYKQLTLVIDRKSHMVRETTITDPVNNTNRVQFTNAVLNRQLPDAGFKFVPPEGVNILH
jgi:outer membrane lipoprotein carrier protein